MVAKIERRGRPKLPKQYVKSHRMYVRMDASTIRLATRLAREKDMDRSHFIRNLIEQAGKLAAQEQAVVS